MGDCPYFPYFQGAAQWIHDYCGGSGADKVAHCYAFCVATRCAGPGAPLVSLIEALYNAAGETRPDHQAANQAGIECAYHLDTCWSCCVAATYGMKCN